MATELSNKSTKNEILDAYESLLKTVKEQKREVPQKIQEEQQNRQVVKKSGELSNELIIKDIANQKINLSAALDKLADSMVEKFREFSQLQEAITIQQAQLKELYQISVQTESLEALIAAHKDQKSKFETDMATSRNSFETDMATRKEAWKAEQALTEKIRKELDEQVKKDRKREDEEYQYNLKITRKKEEDAYTEKKQKLEKELAEKKITFEKEYAEREARVQAAENELADLRQRSEKFPVQLEQAVKQAEKALKEKLDLEFAHKAELAAQKADSEQKLKDQMIVSFRDKIKEQELLIRQLTEKTTTAESSMKEIAIKALDTSTLRIIEAKAEENR
ncbi:MAG: hypothetical protein NTV01_06155 [Bacteroidia bacterium]|nr:hypothetical protein [Bacteroidia bacterium]